MADHQLGKNIDDFVVSFEDYFPSMVEKLGCQGFMEELCKGFRLLMEVQKGMITLDSLKKSAQILGLHDIKDDDLQCMLSEGDLDGDGCLNQREFCVLMFRLSPHLMSRARKWISHQQHP